MASKTTAAPARVARVQDLRRSNASAKHVVKKHRGTRASRFAAEARTHD